jgi:tRNA-dihydrouridine synthase C
MQCYAPPVNWELIGRVRERLRLPVVANGDIHTLADFRRCRDITGCIHFMLGRGAVADPGLAGRVAAELKLQSSPRACERTTHPHWPSLLPQLIAHTPACDRTPAGTLKRLKQWLRIASACGTFAHFDRVKRATSTDELLAVVAAADREG